MDTVDSGLPGGQSQAHWFDTWDRQTSQSFSSTAKGLRNAPGENNCFLNSAVQVFWHIDVFRRSYRRLSGHLCMGHSCIFCALKVIFTQFQYSDQSSLQPSGLRKALANTFAKQERFQLGHMDDAAECFENILNRIHYHIANMYNEDSCNAPHCVSHQKFAMMVFEQLVCPCGATSEPLKFHEMVHYISANALVSQSRAMQESGDMLHPNRFGLLLRNSRAVGDVRDCPGNCGKRVQIRKVLLNVPDVVSIGLVWGSDKADPELTTEVTRAIGTTILYPDMFHSVMCNDASLLPRLHLTSVVCYYGKHYSSFIYQTKLQEWVYFDDATVREVGPDWAQVVDHIISSRYQPLLLIYTNPNAQPVPTETAPSTRVMAPGYTISPNKDTQEETKYQSAADKTQSGSQNCRRSLTPSLEKSEGSTPKGNKDQAQNKPVNEKKLLERTSSFEHRRQTSFLLAVTKKGKEESIYAVPHNNSKVINLQRDISQGELQNMYMKQNSVNYCGDISENRGDPDCYNYTLSTSDQYRRPGFDTQDSNRFPLAQNFSRMGETQRKDIAKKGKGKIPTDVIRCHVDLGMQRNSQSSDSDQSSPINGDVNGLPVSGMNKPVLPVKSGSFNVRSLSVDDDSKNVRVIPETGGILHPVIKPKPGVHGQDNADLATNTFTPVQLGLATLPRMKKPSNITSLVQPSSSSSSHGQQRGSQIEPQVANQYHSYPQDVSTPPQPYLYVNPQNFVPTYYQNCLNYPNVGEQEKHSRQSSSSSILSQGSVIECPTTEDVKGLHCRQISTASQDTLTDKPKETKSKSKKKDKDEKKRDENKQKKEEKKRKGEKREKGTKVSDKPALVPDKNSSPNDEGFSESGYIDRRMVESVLSYQKLQRSGSCVSQVSTSSMESENFIPISGKSLVTPKDNLSSEIPFDSASLDSHKDSGYASSDRTSSSSTGSITMNPYEQYFLSRSMIPPKNLNNLKNSENLRKFMDQSVNSYTQEKDLKSLVSNPNEYQTQTTGYCQSMNTNIPQIGFKSHSQSFTKDLMTLSKAERDQHLYDALSGREKTIAVQPPHIPQQLPEALQHGLKQVTWSKQRPGMNLVPSDVMPLPDNARATDKGHLRNQSPVFYAGSQTVYQTGAHTAVYPTNPTPAEYQLQSTHLGLTCQPVTQGRNVEQFQQPVQDALSQTGSDHFQKLCQVAEDFMDSCVLVETSEQYGDAMNYCQQAIDNLTKAMKLPNIGQSLYTYAQKTSNSCVIKLRSLQKRLLVRPEPSHSANISDSGINHEYRVQKPQPNFQAPINGSKPPSRSSSQNSMDSLSANSSSSRSATPVFDKVVRPSTNDRVPSVEPHILQEEFRNTYPDRRLETIVPEPGANNNTDRYGSLSRRKTQRPPENTYRCISPGHEALAYKDMSDNQRQLNLHNRANSGSITPMNELGYGDSHKTSSFVDPVVPVAVPTHSRQSDEQSTLPMYRPTGQHLKPIPVSPPKLQNQIHHTEFVEADGKHTFISGVSNSYRYTVMYRQPYDSAGCPTHLGPSRTHILEKSQPDLRKLAMDSVIVPQRPLTPQVLCSEPIDECDHRTSVSVKDLLNRFECVTVSTDLNKNKNLEQNVQPMTNAAQPVQLTPISCVTFSDTNDSSRVTLQRQRSKSESESLASMCHPKKPKSVLSKKSKTEVGNKPRKSVTFSTDICLVEAADDWGTIGAGNCMKKAPTQGDGNCDLSSLTSLISLPKKSVEQTRSSSSSCSSSSSSSPVEAVGEGTCALCHKLGVEHGQSYCAKCTYYMSRFTPARC